MPGATGSGTGSSPCRPSATDWPRRGGDLSGFGLLRAGHLYPLEVEGRNIADELASLAPQWLDRIRLVKTDTEGNDLSVIESLSGLIRASRPFLLSEVYKRSGEADRRAFHRTLTGLGYRVFRCEPYTTLQGQELGIDDRMHARQFDLFCVPA
jgi:hypothetical protein